VHGGIREPLGDPVAVGFVGQLFPNLGQVILAVRILDVRQQLRPFPVRYIRRRRRSRVARMAAG
jgi:hypothetical protein